MLKIRLNLRKVIAMIICLAGSMTMFAQDIIIRKNGAEIPAIVQEAWNMDTDLANKMLKSYNTKPGAGVVLDIGLISSRVSLSEEFVARFVNTLCKVILPSGEVSRFAEVKRR